MFVNARMAGCSITAGAEAAALPGQRGRRRRCARLLRQPSLHLGLRAQGQGGMTSGSMGDRSGSAATGRAAGGAGPAAARPPSRSAASLRLCTPHLQCIQEAGVERRHRARHVGGAPRLLALQRTWLGPAAVGTGAAGSQARQPAGQPAASSSAHRCSPSPASSPSQQALLQQPHRRPTCAAAVLPLFSWLSRPPTVHTESGSNSQAASGSIGTQTLPVFGCTQKGACARRVGSMAALEASGWEGMAGVWAQTGTARSHKQQQQHSSRQAGRQARPCAHLEQMVHLF